MCWNIFIRVQQNCLPPLFYTLSMENKKSLMKCIRLECFRNRKKNAYIHLRQIKIWYSIPRKLYDISNVYFLLTYNLQYSIMYVLLLNILDQFLRVLLHVIFLLQFYCSSILKWIQICWNFESSKYVNHFFSTGWFYLKMFKYYSSILKYVKENRKRLNYISILLKFFIILNIINKYKTNK